MNDDEQRTPPPCDGRGDLLSRSAVGQVAVCSCGQLHVTLDYLTLRFEPDAFRELVQMVSGAQRQLDARRGTAAATRREIAGPGELH